MNWICRHKILSARATPRLQNRPLYRFSTSKNLILKIYILYIVHKVIYIQRHMKMTNPCYWKFYFENILFHELKYLQQINIIFISLCIIKKSFSSMPSFESVNYITYYIYSVLWVVVCNFIIYTYISTCSLMSVNIRSYLKRKSKTKKRAILRK